MDSIPRSSRCAKPHCTNHSTDRYTASQLVWNARAVSRQLNPRAQRAKNLEGPQEGQPIGDMKKSWKSTLTAAGINRPFRFHDLRHSCASQLVRNGASLMAVKVILGHESLKTTMRYAHLSPDYIA